MKDRTWGVVLFWFFAHTGHLRWIYSYHWNPVCAFRWWRVIFLLDFLWPLSGASWWSWSRVGVPAAWIFKSSPRVAPGYAWRLEAKPFVFLVHQITPIGRFLWSWYKCLFRRLDFRWSFFSLSRRRCCFFFDFSFVLCFASLLLLLLIIGSVVFLAISFVVLLIWTPRSFRFSSCVCISPVSRFVSVFIISRRRIVIFNSCFSRFLLNTNFSVWLMRSSSWGSTTGVGSSIVSRALFSSLDFFSLLGDFPEFLKLWRLLILSILVVAASAGGNVGRGARDVRTSVWVVLLLSVLGTTVWRQQRLIRVNRRGFYGPRICRVLTFFLRIFAFVLILLLRIRLFALDAFLLLVIVSFRHGFSVAVCGCGIRVLGGNVFGILSASRPLAVVLLRHFFISKLLLLVYKLCSLVRSPVTSCHVIL